MNPWGALHHPIQNLEGWLPKGGNRLHSSKWLPLGFWRISCSRRRRHFPRKGREKRNVAECFSSNKLKKVELQTVSKVVEIWCTSFFTNHTWWLIAWGPFFGFQGVLQKRKQEPEWCIKKLLPDWKKDRWRQKATGFCTNTSFNPYKLPLFITFLTRKNSTANALGWHAVW